MTRRARTILPLAAALLVPGCKKDEPPPAETPPPSRTRTREVKAPDQLPALRLDEFGKQPGFLAGGAIFAAVRAGAAQDFLRQIPLPGEVTRDLARARREIGFDPLTDDVLARFGVPEDAVISMTLGRPVGVEARTQIATELRTRDDRFLGVVARVMNEADEKRWGVIVEEPPPPPPIPPTTGPFPEPEPPPEPEPEPPPMKAPAKRADPIAFVPSEPVAVEAVPPEEKAKPWPEPPPSEILGGVPGGVVGGVLGTAYDPTPPPISPGERREVEELLRKSDGIAMQFRFHIPSEEPSRIFTEFRTRADTKDLARGDALCKGHNTEVCLSDGRGLIIARPDGDAAVLDLLVFTSRFMEESDTEARRKTVAEALADAPAKLDALSDMAGHASLYVDAEALVELFDHERIGSAVRSLSWSGDEPKRAVDRRLREGQSLRKMLAAPRLFTGVLANAHHERDHTQLQVTWPLREDQQELAEKTLAPPVVRVPVPSIEALCKDALFCARSRGVPSPETLGTTLALGVYGDIRALDDVFDDADEMAVVVGMVATWPNLLGSLLWHLPLGEARGAEAALVRGGLESAGRVQGMGLSAKSIELGRFFEVKAEYAAYVRAPIDDVNLVNTALSFAEMHMNPTTLEGVEGTVKMLRIPEDNVPAVLMTREDPDKVEGDDGKDVGHGWLTVVDQPERLSWLLGLPTDEGTEPYAYGEIPDLWRLIATVPDAAGEFGFARTWATERTMRASLQLDDGQPHLVMEVVRAAQDSKKSKKDKD